MYSTELLVAPEDLDGIPAGPGLAAALAALDAAGVAAEHRPWLLAARQRMVSWWESRMYGDMAAIATAYEREHPDTWPEESSPEIACALHLTRRSADAELGLAIDLRDRLPQVADLYRQGVLDRRRVRVLVQGTAHLDVELARQVAARVLPQAAEWTTGQLAYRLRQLCIEIDPEAAAARYAAAVEERRVVAGMNPQGAMDIWAFDLPAARAAQAMDRLDALARRLRSRGESRTMDQLRADVLLDLLCGDTDTVAGTVGITVDLATLAGLTEAPGDLGGYGPVVADIARQLAAASPQATWEWSAYCTGCRDLVDAGTTRRRPTAHQARTVRRRDRHCVFPGCRRPADDCDLDHICDWVRTGRTSACRLALLCRYHHLRKHRSGWTYERLPNGDYRWTSPLGHTYTTRRWRPP